LQFGTTSSAQKRIGSQTVCVTDSHKFGAQNFVCALGEGGRASELICARMTEASTPNIAAAPAYTVDDEQPVYRSLTDAMLSVSMTTLSVSDYSHAYAEANPSPAQHREPPPLRRQVRLVVRAHGARCARSAHASRFRVSDPAPMPCRRARAWFHPFRTPSTTRPNAGGPRASLARPVRMPFRILAVVSSCRIASVVEPHVDARMQGRAVPGDFSWF
jgi:hypothetical protein